jgi:hypothetical protein
MNLIQHICQYNNNNVCFCEPIKNSIFNKGSFIRILYSTSFFSLNGIYLHILLHTTIIEKYYNKYKGYFNISNHQFIIHKIKIIEEQILNKYINQSFSKIPQYKIYEQINNGYIYCDNLENINDNDNIILKISGIWENDKYYGLTYKFFKP